MSDTTDQIFAIASQLTDMARAADVKRLEFPRDSAEHTRLTNYAHDLRNTSDDFCNAGETVALDELAPHYDAMLSVVRDLKEEASKEAAITRVFSIMDRALSIVRSAMTGNVPGLVSGLVSARALLARQP